MFSLSTIALLFLSFHSLVTSSPLTTNNHPTISTNPHTTANLSSPSALDDWENFDYPLPRTPFILKGRIFTSKPLHRPALHNALAGGLAHAQQQLSILGPAAHLFTRDNPYVYAVAGCFVGIRSKTGVGAQVGRPRMTWLMVRDVFLGLQEVLERKGRVFEASFVVVDEEGRSLGHGEVGDGTGRGAGEVE